VPVGSQRFHSAHVQQLQQQLQLSECCRPYHEGEALPPGPLALLRSRYSAYAYRIPTYVMETTHPMMDDFKPEKDKRARLAWRDELLRFCDG
jgi:uncharacterized protein YchJ